MPILPQYNAPALEAPINAGRRATGDDFGVSFGESADRIRGIAAAIQEQTEGEEQRKALVATTEIRARVAKELDEAQVSGASLEPIRQRMQDDLSKISEGFSTKRGSNAIRLYQAQNAQMFDQQSNQIAVTRAASQAMVEGRKMLNAAGQRLTLNPQHLNVILQEIDDFTSTISGVSPEKRASIREQLSKEVNEQAVRSATRIDPAATKKLLEDGAWDLTPDQRHLALNQADDAIKALRLAADAQRVEIERQKREANNKARDDLFKEIVTTREPERLARMILDNRDLTPESREHLFRIMENRYKASKRKVGTGNAAVYLSLWNQAYAPEGDPDKMYDSSRVHAAAAAGLITTRQAENLMRQIGAQRDQDGDAISSRIRTISAGFGDAIQKDPRMLRFTPLERAEIINNLNAGMQRRVDELRKAGVSPSESLDPGSKHFAGSATFAQQFVDDAIRRKTSGAFRGRGASATWGNPTPKTKAEYDALPSGTRYVDTDGVTKVKK